MILSLVDIAEAMVLLDGNQEEFTSSDAMRAIGIENVDELSDALMVRLGAKISGTLMSGIAIGMVLAEKKKGESWDKLST